MKKLDEKYWKIIKYFVLGAGLTYCAIVVLDLAFKLLFDISATMTSISDVFGLTFNILAPFIIGLVFAYLFDPVVMYLQNKYENFEEKHFKAHKEKKLKKLEKKGVVVSPYKKRMAGTAILYLIIILILCVIISLILGSVDMSNEKDVPMSTYIVDKISQTANYITNMNDTIQKKLYEIGVSEYFLTAVQTVFDWVKGLTTSIIGLVVAIAQGVFTGFLGLVMGFYILVDKEAIKAKTLHIMKVFIPDNANRNIIGFFNKMHNVFSGYIRGQLTDAAIYGFLVSIALTIIGVPYGFFVGFVSGFCNLIPYVGAFVAFTLSITIALFSGNPMLAVYAAIVIFALQQLDSVFIYPKCVSSNIDISPLLVILALTVGGSLFGVVGMLFAVPITSLIKLLLGEFINAQEQSGKIKSFLTRKE